MFLEWFELEQQRLLDDVLTKGGCGSAGIAVGRPVAVPIVGTEEDAEGARVHSAPERPQQQQVGRLSAFRRSRWEGDWSKKEEIRHYQRISLVPFSSVCF